MTLGGTQNYKIVILINLPTDEYVLQTAFKNIILFMKCSL